jgi:hypothetical protein
MTDEQTPKLVFPPALPQPMPPIEGALHWKVGENEFNQMIAEGLSKAIANLHDDVPFVPDEQTITAEEAHPFARDGVTPQRRPPQRR